MLVIFDPSILGAVSLLCSNFLCLNFAILKEVANSCRGLQGLKMFKIDKTPPPTIGKTWYCLEVNIVALLDQFAFESSTQTKI